MSVETPVRPDPAGAPGLPPVKPKGNAVKIVGIIVAGLVALSVIGAIAGATSKKEAPSSPAPASPAPSSPAQSQAAAPVTPQAAAHQFAEDVQAGAPQYSVKYGLVEASDLSRDQSFAPVIVVDFGDTAKSFNEWTVMQGVLLGGDADLLTQAGINSYSLVAGKILLAVRVSDAKYVPGPSGQSHSHLLLIKSEPPLVAASDELSTTSPTAPPTTAAPVKRGTYQMKSCDNTFSGNNLIGSTLVKNTGTVPLDFTVTFRWQLGDGSWINANPDHAALGPGKSKLVFFKKPVGINTILNFQQNPGYMQSKNCSTKATY